MRRSIFAILYSFVVLSCFSSSGLRRNFEEPPYEYGPWVFWMWLNGNVSKEGITLDLEAMNQNGISGAVLFTSNAGLPPGHLTYGSKEWFEYNKYTFEEAKRLDMRIMLHNGPGYSITGAPWITPENSMQQVVWSETFLSADATLQNVQLPLPFAKMDYYEDALVIAYPSLKGEDKPMKDHLTTIKLNGVIQDKEKLTNYNYEDYLLLSPEKGNKQAELLLEFDESYEAASILLRRQHTAPPYHPYDGPRDEPPLYTIEYSEDGIDFHPLCKVSMPAVRELDVPVTANFSSVKARYYRLLSNKESKLTELVLYATPRLEDWNRKANYLNSRSQHALEVKDETIPHEAIVRPDEVIDLTSYVTEDGLLTWKAPKGNWTILRIGHTTTGEENEAAPLGGKGLECDKLNKRGVDTHYHLFLKKLFDEMQEYCGNSFYGITIDSWEAGMQNWTKGFEKDFYLRHQYSLIPYMAAFTGRIVASTSTTEYFLADIRQTQATLLAENFHQRMREHCHNHHLTFLCEPYGDGVFNSMEISKYIDIPSGEFWAHGLYGGSHTNNMARYNSRMYGRKIAAAEAFTAMPDLSRFTEYPAAMKPEGDWMFCNGINRYMYHTYAHQPHPTAKPGMVMGPFGTHFNRNQTWWNVSRSYIDYVRRCQYLLQNGRFISNSSSWAPPENGKLQNDAEKTDFSYISMNPNAIINYIHRKQDHMDYYFVSNNKRSDEQIMASFSITGKQPEIWNPETGEQYKVYNYKQKAGKTIIPLSLQPAESLFIVFSETPDKEPVWIRNFPEDLQQFPPSPGFSNNFTISVWLRPDVPAVSGRSYVLYPQSGEQLYGKGNACVALAVGQNGIRVFEQSGSRSEQVLFAETKIEGWSLITLVYEENKPILYINGKNHAEGNRSSYTVHSSSKEIADNDPVITLFQGEYMIPAIVNYSLTAKEVMEQYKRGRNIREFGQEGEIVKGDKIRIIKEGIDISDNWKMELPGEGDQQKIIEMKSLSSLHLHPRQEVKYFSGTVTYHKQVVIPNEYLDKDKRLILDLGNVAFFAEVYINGKEVKTLWKPPYSCDLTEYLSPGENQLAIKVTNLWTNRLIGDEQLPVENEYDQWGELTKFPDWYANNQPYEGKRTTFVSWKQYDKNGPLTESGLIGPVKLHSVIEKKIVE